MMTTTPMFPAPPNVPPATAAAPARTIVTDTKFEELKKKLRELFELDKSDLDFGIYRIMAAKNKEVTDFLDRQLKDVVRETLAAHGAGASDQVQMELDKVMAQAQALGADPEALPKVKELRAKLAAAGGASAAELEADIYNHLLAFFGRYYDEGDFISKRRYKGDVYAIPYGGEEVTLHWANKDQYYIKSGEWHKDYRFKVGGGKTVRFKLVEATQETNNNKEPDEAKRRYILDAAKPVEEEAGELALRFHFRVPTEAEKSAAGEATRIYGGKFDAGSGRTKGDEREQFCADSEKRAMANISMAWLPLITAAASTDSKPLRTLLGKHLEDFAARNAFDYFIHKDLGGFLRRELDFYIKNEVVRLDDLEALPGDQLQRVQGKVKAIRRVAGRMIEFLASIENFQKKMWLKKKLVLGTNWLVTVDRIPPTLRDVVAGNVKQWEEWERLGLKPDASNVTEAQGSLDPFVAAAWGTRPFLDQHDKLPVDTAFFDRLFLSDLLAAKTDATPAENREHVLVHSENFHALNILGETYRAQIQCVYIDPPYNTGSSAILYKNDFKHSAWWTLMSNRVQLLHFLLAPSGVLFASIDKNERLGLEQVLDHAFNQNNHIEELIWTQNTANGQLPNYSTNHEYVEVYARNRKIAEADEGMFREPKPGFADIMDVLEQIKGSRPPIRDVEAAIKKLFNDHLIAYREQMEQMGVEWTDEIKKQDPWKGLYNYGNVEYRDSAGKYLTEEKGRLEPTARLWVWREISPSAPAAKQAATTKDPQHFNYRYYKPLHPHTGQPCPHPKGGWKFPYQPHADHPDRRTFVELDADRRIAWGVDEITVPQTKGFLHEVETNISTSVFYEYNDGEAEVSRMFGQSGLFLSPKSSKFVRRFIAQSTDRQDYVIDCFGGSGSTGHAVLDMNRDDHGVRRVLLAEAGEHFSTVLKPRFTKAIYSPDWKDGRAQTHGKGVSALVKYFALESYEDALNNLPAPTGGLLAGMDAAAKEAMITYSLDLEVGPNLLNLEMFRDPWGYAINAQPAGVAEIRKHAVDLVETFNYLLGLKVKVYGPLERYSAEFEKAKHAEELGRVKVKGRLKRDKDGPFVFQRVEGELNDSEGTRVLVVWRKLTDDAEQDAAVLEWWMDHRGEPTTERSPYTQFKQIYINGPVTLPQPTAEIRTVFPIEQTFKDQMFADTDGAQHG